MSEKKGVEIDYCPNCRGIWLDRGELDKIIEQSATHYSKKESYDNDHQQYQSKGYDNDYYQRNPHKKKKSFLNDFFDF